MVQSAVPSPAKGEEGEADFALVLVANRLPVTVRRTREGTEFRPSTGGLASGLGAFYKELDAKWVGWPGETISRGRAGIERRLVSEFRSYPVLLPESLARRYYSGFSNRTLWPLFHSLAARVNYAPSEWEAYREVNKRFADKVARIAGPRDVIWVHDYHLLLLPAALRVRLPDARIGFFLHIPFPPYDILRIMPRHRELVEGLVGADLIGFHTYDYAQTFLRSCRRLLSLDNNIGQMLVGDRIVGVDVFPMGVDFARLAKAGEDSAVQREIVRVRRRVGPSRLIFSLSRLDYTKGIPEQLEAVRTLLQGHPEWRGRLVYVSVVVPSREGVDRYANLKREIDEIVGRINSRFGTIDWMPIQYMYRRLSEPELHALYSRADVALVTPLRDGMNLIAKEYIATRTDERGVLVLSEMAGAARELLEALIVNPNDREEIAGALHRGLTMPEAEQVARNRAMRARLRERDVHHWARRFLDRLDEIRARSQSLAVRLLTQLTRREIVAHYSRAGRRLLLLDYDGSLVPFVPDPSAATPPRAVRDLLAALARTPGNEVYLISGRRRSDLEAWFGDLDLTLVGEHGAWVRNRGSSRWEAAGAKVTSWKDRIRPILQLFVERVPGSFVEEKDFSIAWHYRGSDVESGSSAAKELVDTLTNLTANLDATVLAGNRVVEVASSHANKGHLFASRLADTDWDFILAIGDDSTDEHLFAALPPDAYSIRVGITASAARFNVSGPEGAIALLNGLLMAPRGAKKNPPRRPRLDPVGGAGRGTGTKRSSPQRGLHG